jgi:acetyltransferase-like isoleucine patch superfamily enzyme
MKIIETIGVGRALRFLWYWWFTWLLHICLPPVRVLLLRFAGAKIGSDTIILDVVFVNVYHYGFSKIRIGKRCYVGDGVMIDVRGGVALEDDVTLSNRVCVVSHINVGYPEHPLQRYFPTKESKVTIQKGVYVGTAAIILSGVSIGRESVIGAGAVVTKNIPSRVVAHGVPAKVVRSI